MPDALTPKALRLRTVAALNAAGVLSSQFTASRRQPVTDDALPLGLVYTPTLNYSSPGPTLGEPHFSATCQINIDALLSEDDEDDLDDALDDLATEILDTLLCDPAWLIGIDGVLSVSVDKYPQDEKGALLLAGLRVSLQVSLGETRFEPDVTDRLTKIGMRPITSGDITTEFGIDFDGDGKADVTLEINLPQD